MDLHGLKAGKSFTSGKAAYLQPPTCCNATPMCKTESPRDWNDLLDSKWKGQLAIDQEGYRMVTPDY